MDAEGTAIPDDVPVPGSVAGGRAAVVRPITAAMLDAMVESFTKNNFAQELWVRAPIAEGTALALRRRAILS